MHQARWAEKCVAFTGWRGKAVRPGENVAHQQADRAQKLTTPYSSPSKTYTVVNQLCEGAIGGPATPFFL